MGERSIKELSAIVTEAYGMLFVADWAGVDARLAEMAASPDDHHPEDLAMWLRSAYCRHERLPSWHALRVAAIESVRRRSGDERARTMFMGFVEGTRMYDANFGTKTAPENQ